MEEGEEPYEDLTGTAQVEESMQQVGREGLGQENCSEEVPEPPAPAAIPEKGQTKNGQSAQRTNEGRARGACSHILPHIALGVCIACGTAAGIARTGSSIMS